MDERNPRDVGTKAFNVCWPNGKMGLVLCQSELQLYEVLEAETDMTQCTVAEVKKDFLIMFDSQTNVYTEKKNEYYREIDPAPSLSDELYKLHLSGELCDVALKVEDKVILCHKTVLAARSSYFRTMFTSPLKEISLKEIEIKGFSHELFDAVIKFMYTSELNLGLENAEESFEDELSSLKAFLMAADYFHIPSLIAYVQQQISKLCAFNPKRNMSISHIQLLVEIYETAVELNLSDLQRNIASCMPVDASLHGMDLSASLQDDVTAAFRIDHRTGFYFGANHKLYDLLETGLLSRLSTLENIALLEAEGADARAICAGHVLINRACNRMMCCPDMSESTWQAVKYFLEQRAYPINCLDHHGQSMLQIAAIHRHEELVARLLQAGASPHVTDIRGMSIIDDVKVNCDNDIAYFICTDVLLAMDFMSEVTENPSCVLSMMHQHKELWIKARDIMRLLLAASSTADTMMFSDRYFTARTRSESAEREKYAQCLKALDICLNDAFIEKAVDVYMLNACPSSCLPEGLDFVQVSGPFSRQFYWETMKHLYPSFMTYMELPDDTRTLEEVTKNIRECLTRDIARTRLLENKQLCSLRQLQQFNVFALLPANSWIAEAITVLAT